MKPAEPEFAPLVDQLANIRRWNGDRAWGLSEAELAMVDLMHADHASPLVVDVLAVNLPGNDEANGVQRTCGEMWDIASERQPNAWCWDERKDGPKPVRRLDGGHQRPGIRRVTLDLPGPLRLAGARAGAVQCDPILVLITASMWARSSGRKWRRQP